MQQRSEVNETKYLVLKANSIVPGLAFCPVNDAAGNRLDLDGNKVPANFGRAAGQAEQRQGIGFASGLRPALDPARLTNTARTERA